MKLWRVSRPEAETDYDEMQEAVVWAESAEQAEELMRAAHRYPEEERASTTMPWVRNAKWIRETWALIVEEVPVEVGVVLVHWHAG